MALARRTARTRPLIVLLVLVSITLVAIDQSGDDSPLHPIRSAFRDTFAAVGDGADNLWPFGDGEAVRRLQAENDQLRAQLGEANGRLAAMADTERERRELTALLELPTIDNAPKVIASVVKLGGSNFQATAELSKGSDSGIEVGMPVVTGEGLVGRVIQTSSTRSTVLLVTDATSNVSVRYVDAGDVGVAAGTGEGRELRGELIELSSAIKAGEVAVTSGLDGSLFPSGIPVVRVASTAAGRQDLRRDVRLEPIVDFDKLDNVAVVQWRA